MSADHQSVRNWLTALGTLTAGAMSEQEAQTKIGAYAPLLAREFGQACFCAATLSHVARLCKFFPAYSEVCEHLSAWWKEHHPVDATLISGPTYGARGDDNEARDQARRDWANPGNVRFAVQSLDGHPMRDLLGGMLGGLVQRHAPENVKFLPVEFQGAAT